MSPGLSCAISSGRSVSPTIFCPSTATITSPPAVTCWPWKWICWSPRPGGRRRRPGRPGSTLATSAPVVDVDAEPVGELRVERLGGDADVGVLDRAVVAELVERALDEVDRDREADALVAARGRVDLLVDADHAAVGVEQRAARVARVDRGVGLDRALDLEVGQRRRSSGRWPRRRRPRATAPAPNGLPIAATGSPTWTSSSVAELQRVQVEAVGSTLSSATSAFGSKPTISAATWLRSANWT